MRRARTSQGRIGAALAIVGAMLMSTGFAVMGAVGAASADPPPHQDNFKVFVCKYVGKPRVSELLQGGGNPLSVSVNSIPNLEDGNGDPIPWTLGNVVGHEFADAQGQSLVIAVDDTAPGPEGDPTADQCPGSTPQPTVVTPSLSLNQMECPPRDSIGWRGLVNGVFDSPTDHVEFVLTGGTAAPGQTITVTATASGGVTFAGGTTMQLTGTFDPAPTNCGGGGPQNQLTTPSVTFAEPTCENPNGAQINLGNQDKVSYGVVGAAGPGAGVTVKASPKAGFAFAAGVRTEFSHEFKTLESLNCPSEQPTVVPSEEPTVGGTQTTRPRPDTKPKPKPNEERPPVVLGTQAGVPSAVAAGLPGAPTAGSGSSTLLAAQLMVGTGLVLLVAGGWTGMGTRRSRSGAHQV